MTILVERIVIRENHPNFSPCRRYCTNAKSVGNSATFVMRRLVVDNSKAIKQYLEEQPKNSANQNQDIDFSSIPGVKPLLSEGDLDKFIRAHYPNYSFISSALAQNMVFLARADFSHHFAAKAEWKRNKGEFQ